MRPVYQGKTEHYALCAQHVTPGPRAVETWKWKVVFRSSAQTVRDVLCWGATTAHVCLHRRTQTNVHTMIMVLYAGQENELAVFERWNQICLHTWRGWMWRTDFFFLFFSFSTTHQTILLDFASCAYKSLLMLLLSWSSSADWMGPHLADGRLDYYITPMFDQVEPTRWLYVENCILCHSKCYVSSFVIFPVNFSGKADWLMFFDGHVGVVNEFNRQIFLIFYCVELEKLKQKYKLGRI